MQSREFKFYPNYNFAVDSVFTFVNQGKAAPMPPVTNFFLLLDGTDFNLLDGTNFLLLGS